MPTATVLMTKKDLNGSEPPVPPAPCVVTGLLAACSVGGHGTRTGAGFHPPSHMSRGTLR
eukprot:CAMPEP_0175622044 /NCGR_PEP_ID=MMETSP0096-20121207/68727_1 /TAXON_ID=311494 /ORGANISM="Alexandrium monilatum, Strain CCMP3105" /LENGTH=59 /DNA_ID=CAMNT_0016927291 /DNA_START=133 /DNA_END=312 /DNA_ORIENTATION=+